MEEKTLKLSDLMFGLAIGSKYLPAKIEYKGVTYFRERHMLTYANVDNPGDLLKIDTIELATGESVKVIEDVNEKDNTALIEKIVNKIDYIEDQLSNLESAIDDIDVRYEVEEATSQANDVEYEVGELRNLVDELKGE